ncbi:MAG: helix-turn-helix domain-containing protein, partial [Phycisphaeraceae bacterium]
LYIDDFSRASRAAIETYRLARLMEVLRLRLIGVNDSFVLGTDAARIQIMAAAMFNEWFIDQLRKKVLRGMKGAAARGTAIGAVRLGYKLVNKLDDNGNPIITTKNKPLRIPVVDDDTKGYVIQAARWFAEDHLSYKEIARRFNAEKVNGSTSWTGSHISKMLACETYIGVRIYNRNQTLWDKETGEFIVEPNPESEWVVTEMPQLRIIGDDLWKGLRDRADEVAAKSNRTGKKLNRRGQALPECQINDLYPTTIVDGVLFCSSCGRAMRLVRSEGESKQVGCPNGSHHVHDCTFHSSKSIRLITAGLSRYVMDEVLTKDRIGELVSTANEYLTEEAEKPRTDLAPLRQALADAQREEEHVVNLVCKLKADHDVTKYMAKSDELREKVVYLQKQLAEAEAANAEPPPPLNLDAVLEHLDDLRGLLEQNVEKSAHALQALLGKVMVYEADVPGRKRKAWVAKINGDIVPLMAHAAKFDGIPDLDTWEFLKTRIWSFKFSAEISLDDPPKYERHAEEFKALHDEGVSIEMIASRFGMSPHWVATAIKFATTGERPRVRPSRRNKNYAGKPAKYTVIADDVTRLKAEKMTIPKIIDWLARQRDIDVSEATVRRAWDYANPEAVKQAVEVRATPTERAQYRRLSAEKIDQVKQLLAEGRGVAAIAKEVGCGKSTIYRIRRDL